jgi:hypothetical protein
MTPVSQMKAEVNAVYLTYIKYMDAKAVVIFRLGKDSLEVLQNTSSATDIFQNKTVEIRAAYLPSNSVSHKNHIFDRFFKSATCLFKLTSDEVNGFVAVML